MNGVETLSGTPAPTSDVNRVVHPFDRVVVYVRLVEDLAGDAVGAVWAELGEAGGRPPAGNPDNDDDTVDRQFSWRLSARASDLGTAAGLAVPAAVTVRAVGWAGDGRGVASGTATIVLSEDGPVG